MFADVLVVYVGDVLKFGRQMVLCHKPSGLLGYLIIPVDLAANNEQHMSKNGFFLCSDPPRDQTARLKLLSCNMMLPATIFTDTQ